MGAVTGWLVAVLTVAIVIAAIFAARSDWARRSDERIMRSWFGWLLPGGAATKLGRRDRSPKTRLSAYVIGGPVQGWLYNLARQANADADAEAARENTVAPLRVPVKQVDAEDQILPVRSARRPK